MANIFINDRIRLSRQQLQVKDANGKWTTLHYQQGGLDGACAVYSTIMALLCIGYISKEDVGIEESRKPDKRTTIGKLLSHLLEEQGLIRSGYFLPTMAKELKSFCTNLDINVHSKTSNFKEIIKAYVENDTPVVLHIVNNDFSHAILAIGTEYDEHEYLHKIFCLDPGYAINKSSYWNCVIDTSRNNNGEFPFWCITDDNKSKVEIRSILAIDWRRAVD